VGRTDAGSADWIVQGVRDDYTVGSLVPTVFEDDARVFHPASRDHRIGDESIEVRWADVASANNRTMHPAAEWGSLTGSWQLQEQPEQWNQEPRTGKLPKRLAKNLAELLAGHTRTSDRCPSRTPKQWVPTLMFLFKDGTSEEVRQRTQEDAQEALEAEVAAWRGLLDVARTFDIPHRTMHLLEGPLEARCRSSMSLAATCRASGGPQTAPGAWRQTST
jgi:hypothetical protein